MLQHSQKFSFGDATYMGVLTMGIQVFYFKIFIYFRRAGECTKIHILRPKIKKKSWVIPLPIFRGNPLPIHTFILYSQPQAGSEV